MNETLLASASSLSKLPIELSSAGHGTLTFFLFVFVFNLFIFIYFWLRWVFIAACGLSLVAVSGGYSSLWCAGFSLQWLLLLRNTGSRRTGFSSCGMWTQQLWHTGSRAQAQ